MRMRSGFKTQRPFSYLSAAGDASNNMDWMPSDVKRVASATPRWMLQVLVDKEMVGFQTFFDNLVHRTTSPQEHACKLSRVQRGI